MEGSGDAGPKVKDERSSEDDITVVEDEDDAVVKEAGDLNVGASSKGKQHADQESESQSTEAFEYTMHGALDDDISPLESQQDSHGTNVDSDVSGFHVSMDQGLDQGGWSWNKDSEVQPGSRDMVPASKGTSKVRRFQCGVCGTNFTLLKNAKRHYRCQHLNYYYWCKYCPNGKETRRYTRREFLEDHFRLHHPDTLCEVAEVGKQVRTDEYNIVCVEICEDEEEEEEVGVELVTTTDANLAGRSTLEPASSRGAFEGSLLLHHAEQRERSETNARGNFINLADYHLANESLPSGANVSGSVQKRMQRTSPVSEQSSKVRRLENERNMNLESDIPYADGILHERDVAPSATRWVSPSGQTLLSHATAPNQSALTTSRSQFSRHDGSFSGHPVLHGSSATTQDCLVIGSAIPPAAGKDTALTPSPPAAQPPIRHSSPQIASSSTKHHLGQSPVMQNIHHQLPKRPNHLLPNQRQHISLANASGIGRNVSEEGNIVISSSDTTYRKQQRDATQQHSREVLVTEGEVPAAAALSCKEIFEKYHDNISKYSKEINFKYDSSGKAVRRKIIKHVFVFGNSQSELSRQEYAETQTADRSASR